jgi:hypothetical protein
MARKSFLDQMMEIRLADEAKQTLATFQEINSPGPKADREAKAPLSQNTSIDKSNDASIDEPIDPSKQPSKQPNDPLTIDQPTNPDINPNTGPNSDPVVNNTVGTTTNQPINQNLQSSIETAKQQLINQDLRPPIETSTHQPINQELQPSIQTTEHQLINQKPQPSIGNTAYQSNDLIVTPSINNTKHTSNDIVAQPSIETPGQRNTAPAYRTSNDQSFATTNIPSSGASSSEHVYTSNDASFGRQFSKWDLPREIRGLTKNDLIVLRFVVKHDPLVIGIEELARRNGMSYGSVKTCIKKLENKGYFSKGRVVDGSAAGTGFSLPVSTKVIFMEHGELIDKVISYREMTESTINMGIEDTRQMVHQMTDQRAHQLREHTERPALKISNGTTIPSLDRKIKENLSILEKLEDEAKELYRIDDDDMSLLLPDLYRAGFTAINVKSLVEKRHKHGLDLSAPTVRMIRMGMRHADAALRIGEGTFKGTINTAIENIVSYTFSTLLREASFPKPPGWEPEEVIAQRLEMERLAQETERFRLESELKADVEAREKKEREEQDYQDWRTSLNPEDVAAYKARCPNKKSEESLERFLRVEWRKTLG